MDTKNFESELKEFLNVYTLYLREYCKDSDFQNINLDLFLHVFFTEETGKAVIEIFKKKITNIQPRGLVNKKKYRKEISQRKSALVSG